MLTDSKCACECVCTPVYLSARLFDNDSVRIIISLIQCSSEGSLNVSGLKRAKQTFYIGAFQLNRQIRSKYPAEKLKLRGAVRRHHERAQTCLCVPCDAVAAQRLTGCIRESPSEG